MGIIHKKCEVCDNPFETIFSKKKYCSEDCKKKVVKLQQRAKYFRKKAAIEKDPEIKKRFLLQSKMGFNAFCDECDKIFNTHGKKAVRYCSDECRKIARLRGFRIKQRQKRGVDIQIDGVIKKSILFKRKDEAFKEKKMKEREFKFNVLEDNKIKNCLVCKNTFKVGQGGGKYCSDECKDIAKREYYMNNRKTLADEKFEAEKTEEFTINPFFLKRGDVNKIKGIASSLSVGA
jgi:predicted nucleic acid-binding Zn ribbon protein